MNNSQIFVLGTGRSGTTLIQRFLNAHKDVMIWGEHSGFLDMVASSYFCIKNNSSMHAFSYQEAAPADCTDLSGFYKDPKRWQAWNNWFQPKEVDQFYRSLLEQIFNPGQVGEMRVWGFKEIRYGEDIQVIRFLQTLYPNAIFLTVVREGLNVIESQLKHFHGGTPKHPRLRRLFQLRTLVRVAVSWARMNSNFYRLAASSGNFYFIKYEAFVSDYRVIRELMQKLGLEIEQPQIDVLSLQEGRGSSFAQSSDENARWRDMGMIPALLAEIIVGKVSQKFGYKRPKSLRLGTFLSRLFGKG